MNESESNFILQKLSVNLHKMEDSTDIPSAIEYPLLSRLAQLFLFFFTGMFIGQALLQLLLSQEGKELQELVESVRAGNPEQSLWILSMQALNQVWGFGLAAVACGLLSGELKSLAPWSKISLQSMGLVILLVLLCIPIIPLISWNADSFRLPESLQAIEQLLEQAETDAENLLKSLTTGEGRVPKGLQLLVFACLPAICEELFFRGAVQYYFSKRFGAVPGIWLTGLLFSLIHFQIYGFLARFLLGAFFGYLVYWSGSLLPAIIGHFVFNASSLFLMDQKNSVISDSEGVFPWHLSLLAIAGFVLILYRLRIHFHNFRTHGPKI